MTKPAPIRGRPPRLSRDALVEAAEARGEQWLTGLPTRSRPSVHHAELRVGSNGMIMLGSARENDYGMKTPRETGAHTGGVYVIVDDPDVWHFGTYPSGNLSEVTGDG
jgi:hypothetical protein